MTEEFELCLKGWQPLCSLEAPFPYLEAKFKVRAQESAATMLAQNTTNARGMLEDEEWMTEILLDACQEAGLKIEADHPAVSTVLQELKQNASNDDNFCNPRGQLYIFSKGSRGKIGRGKVPARADVLFQQLLGKTPEILQKMLPAA